MEYKKSPIIITFVSMERKKILILLSGTNFNNYLMPKIKPFDIALVKLPNYY